MNGILSGHPCQSAVRLLVGSHGLMLTQSALMMWGGFIDAAARGLSIIVLAVAIVASAGALVGDAHADHDRTWRLRHGR